MSSFPAVWTALVHAAWVNWTGLAQGPIFAVRHPARPDDRL